jgi:hypothetical protein
MCTTQHFPPSPDKPQFITEDCNISHMNRNIRCTIGLVARKQRWNKVLVSLNNPPLETNFPNMMPHFETPN